MDKTLAELALLNVGDSLWASHGELWSEKAREWARGGPAWLQVVRYVDITTDPYWTDRYALSGKVSRTGTVMPSLSRVAVMGGPGVPLLMRTGAGAQSLKKLLLEAMKDTGGLGGPGDLARVTVVDAEAASVALLTTLAELPGHCFITVLKGQGAKNVVVEPAGEWVSYRDKDRVRTCRVVLTGKDAPPEGLALTCVEMQRENSRHPHRTLFLTNAGPELLSATEVADIYLSRWPNQEGVFREARNGAGLDRSHGYGGDNVTHVAFETRFEAAEKSLSRAEKRAAVADKQLKDAEALKESATREQRAAAGEAARQAERRLREATKAVTVAQKKKESQETMPREIFQRDTTRENIATAATMMVMLLVEWVLREYFGGLKIELRTFLEFFLYPAVEVRTSARQILYRLETADLPAMRAEQLREACVTITKRELRKDGRLLIFETVDRLGSSPGIK